MPAGTENFDIGLFLMAPDRKGLDEKLALGRAALQGLHGLNLAGSD
jgi:hypothetical protein